MLRKKHSHGMSAHRFTDPPEGSPSQATLELLFIFSLPPRRKQGKQQLSTGEKLPFFLNLPGMIHKINNSLIVWRKQEDLSLKTQVWVLKLISTASCKMPESLGFHSQRISVLKGQHLLAESFQVCQVMFQLL